MIAGIDLGTTNSLIGVMDAGFPVLIADAEGRRLTPSVAHFPASGEPLVGQPAARMHAADPTRTVSSIKRRIGEPVRLDFGEKKLLPEEISALTLAKLRADAERALGQPVTRAVITVPAYFNDAQRNATKRAGELAGFTVERILNEPTAAALAYGLDRLDERARVAVYDLGGGTFDLSIVELNGGVFQVLATNGNTQLGGDDIDHALCLWLETTLGGAWTAHDRARLRDAAIELKHRLSEHTDARLELPFLADGRSVACTVTRAELEHIAAPIIERTRAHCLRALADAKLDVAELSEVILVGGQTRMPLVRAFVGALFNREPNLSQNPDEAVALGATIQAGVLDGAVQNIVLLDVTPLSLGIETFGGLMNVIIPRNSTIPCKAGELFTNAVAGQTAVSVRVLQGEREMARDNWELGHFDLAFDPAPKGQARVGVQFSIDANGILEVLARDTRTGQEKTVRITSAVDVSDEAVEKMLADSLEHAFDDMSERQFVEQQAKAESLAKVTRHALTLPGLAIPDDERATITARLAELESALAEKSAHRLKPAISQLDDATQPLAARMMEAAMRGETT